MDQGGSVDPVITGTRMPKASQNGQTGTRNKFLSTFVLLGLFFLSCLAFGLLVLVIAGSTDPP